MLTPDQEVAMDGLKITLQQAAGNLPRKEFNQSIIRSLTPQHAAGNALAIAVQKAPFLKMRGGVLIYKIIYRSR